MSSLTITRSYATGEALLEADLDAIRLAVPTLLGTTFLETDNFAENAITISSKVIDSSITTATIADSAITSEKIAADAVTTVKIADSAVTTAKLYDIHITTAKIADGNVTNAKLATSTFLEATSGNSVSETVTVEARGAAGNNTLVTAASKAITSTGRPIMITLGEFNLFSVEGQTANNGTSSVPSDIVGAYVSFLRDSTEIARFNLHGGQSGALNAYMKVPASTFWYIDQPSAGTYTYYVKISPHQTATTSNNWPRITVTFRASLKLLEI